MRRSGDRRHLAAKENRAATVATAPRRLRILINSAYYWPEPAGSAPYVTDLAEYLQQQGHSVTVLTAFPHYPTWRATSRGRLAARHTHQGVLIRRRWAYVPSRQSTAQRALYEASFFCLGLSGLRTSPRPDLVLGTSPILASAYLAAAAGRAHGVPYVLIFQDLMGLAAEQSGVRGGHRVAKLLRNAEHRVARGAAAVVIPAEGFRPYFLDGGVKPHVIYRLRNWTRRVEPQREHTVTRAELGWSEEEFVCIHGGNLGLKQALDNVVSAAALLDGQSVRIVFAGDGSERQRLERRVRDLGLRNVSFVLSPSPGRYEALLATADLALVNQRGSVKDMSLPSKLTSYLAAGRPVLAAVSPNSETGRELQAADAGLIVPPDDPEALAAAVLAARESKPSLAALGANGRRFAQTHFSQAQLLAAFEMFLCDLCERAAGRGATSTSVSAPISSAR